MLGETRTRYKPSFKTDRELVKVLALEKEYAQYDMPKRLGKNYRTVLRHLQDLREQGFVRLCRTEESRKGGKDRNIFTLTDLGLLYALGYSDIWAEIDKVAKNYADLLPLIFGKWDFYLKKGLRNEIIVRLQAAVQGFFTQLGREWYRIVKAHPNRTMKIKLQKLKGSEIAEEIMARHRAVAPTLTHKVLGLSPYLWLGLPEEVSRKHREFIGVLIEDSELRKFYDEEFDHWVKQSKLEYDEALHALKWYRELKASKTSNQG